MMKLMSNDEVDKLKLKSKKNLSEKKITSKKRKLNLSYQKIYTFWCYVVNDEVPSTFSQIDEQIEVVQEVVLPEIAKLND